MKKITKKLANVALAATILGTGTVATLVADTPQAQAAYFSADYNGQKAVALIDLPSSWYPQQSYGVFFIGSYIELYTSIKRGDQVVDTKMYLKKSDGSLQRYKTWTAAEHNNYGTSVDLSQPITTGFPEGTYVAVLTLKDSGGTLYQLKSTDITIKK